MGINTKNRYFHRDHRYDGKELKRCLVNIQKKATDNLFPPETLSNGNNNIEADTVYIFCLCQVAWFSWDIMFHIRDLM